MPAKRTPQPKKQGPTDSVAVATGGGAGLLFAHMVSAMKQDQWKDTLILLGPIVTIAAGGLYILARRLFDWEVFNRFMDMAIKSAGEQYAIAEKDPNSSLEYKQELLQILQKLKIAKLKGLYSIVYLGVTPRISTFESP